MADIKMLGKPLEKLSDQDAFSLIKSIRLSRRVKKGKFSVRITSSTTKNTTRKKASKKQPSNPRDLIKLMSDNQKNELIKMLEGIE